MKSMMVAVVAALAATFAFARQRGLGFVATETGGSSFSSTTDNAEIVKVKGRGVGADKAEALKDAYRDAVERAVGLYVDAEQLMKNEELVKDQILTQSNAYIEKYEVAKETAKPNGLVEVQIIAEVRKTVLAKKISDVMPDKTFRLGGELQNAHAKINTTEKRNADGAALLENVLKDLDPLELSLDYSLASSEAVIGDFSERMGNSSSGTVRVNYLFKAKIDEKRFFEKVAGRLTEVLEQISIDKPQDVTISLQPRPVSYVGRETKVNVPAMFEKARATVKGALHRDHFKRSEHETAELKMPSQLSGESYDRSNNFAKETQVLVVTKANKFKTVFSARLYKLDANSSKVFRSWQRNRFSGLSGYKRPKLSIAFLDNSGESLYVETCHLSMESSIDKRDGWIFAPWFDSYGSYRVTLVAYEWRGFDLPKEVLPEVKDMKIEIVK